MKVYGTIMQVVALVISSCGNNGPTPTDTGDSSTSEDDGGGITIPASCEGGSVVYGVGGKHYRTTLDSTATTEDLSAGLAQLSAGQDEWISVSPDGEWLVMETTRFDPECQGWACLAVVKADLSEGKAVRLGSDLLHGDNFSAIASGGKLVVYPDSGGPHQQDLYAITLSGTTWSSPKLLTAGSTHSYNLQPSISADGSKVVFDCGEDPYGQPPTSICEAATDGSSFRQVWTPEQGGEGALGRRDVALHHPDYFSDGSIVFESDWNSEQIWKLSGQGPPTVIANTYSNDNSPCVTQKDCVVSIWLGRSGGSGTHEIKIMDSAGGNFSMVRTGIDVVDTGTGCGGN